MYDFVIVGAGSAGCVLAARLSENPNCQVLLLEAGPPDKKLEIHIPAAFNKLFKTKYDWAYETEPQANLNGRAMFWPRGKTLGGSSSLNAMMYVRGNSLDYDHWAELGNKGWAYGDVLPYFERSERSERGTAPRRGTSGPLNIADLRDPNPTTVAFLEAGGTSGRPTHEGRERSRSRRRRLHASHAEARAPMERGGRLSQAGAQAPQSHRGHGRTRQRSSSTAPVPLRSSTSPTARRSKTQANEVLVSGGAINSPQLLMLSGIGPADQLAALGIPVVAGPARRRKEPAGPSRHHGHRALEGTGHARGRRVVAEPRALLDHGARNAHVEHRRSVRLRADASRARRARPRAHLRSSAVHRSRPGAAARARDHHRLRRRDSAQRGRAHVAFCRSVRRASDRAELSLRSRRRGSPRARGGLEDRAPDLRRAGARPVLGRSASATGAADLRRRDRRARSSRLPRRCTTRSVPARWAPTISRSWIPS